MHDITQELPGESQDIRIHIVRNGYFAYFGQQPNLNDKIATVSKE